MNAEVKCIAIPGDIRIRTRLKTNQSQVDRRITIPLEIVHPEKNLAVLLQELQEHECLVSVALRQPELFGEDADEPAAMSTGAKAATDDEAEAQPADEAEAQDPPAARGTRPRSRRGRSKGNSGTTSSTGLL